MANADFPAREELGESADTAAEKSGWERKLPEELDGFIAIGDGRRPGVKEVTICAVVATVSVRQEKARFGWNGFDVAMDTDSSW